MASETFKVAGLRELGLAMKDLSSDIQKKVARQAVAAGAGVIRKAAKEKAPVDSGNLKAAIVMKRDSKSWLSAEYVVAVRKGKKSDIRAAKSGAGKKGKDAFYARFIEFGTVKMPAQPFIRPAFEDNKVQAVDAIAKRLKARIDKVNAKKSS